MFRRFAVFILLSTLAFGQSVYITSQQDKTGLWLLNDKCDILGSALAINQLARSKNTKASLLRARQSAAAYRSSANYLFASILGSLSTNPPGNISQYRWTDGSYSLEPNTPGNPLCTAWVLMLLGNHLPAEQLSQSVTYLLSTDAGAPSSLSYYNDFRYTLFIITALAKNYTQCQDCFPSLWRQQICAMLQEYQNSWDYYFAQSLETALMTLTTAKLSDWENASRFRESLLNACNSKTGWSDGYQSFDLVTTCFALEALSLFSLAVPSATPDLSFPHSPVRQTDGTYSVLLYNIGSAPAELFHVNIYSINESGATALEQHLSIPLLNVGRSTKIQFTCPESTTAIIIKADEECLIQDLSRNNNATYLMLKSCAYFSLSPLLVNGIDSDTPVFLQPGKGVKLSAVMHMLYPHTETSATYSWKADDTTFSSGKVNGLGLETELSCQWHPVKGQYNITLYVQATIGSGTRKKTLFFTYDEAICYSKRNVDGTLQYCDTFLPREYVNLYVYAADSTLTPTVHIFKDGVLLRQANAVDSHHFQWFTGTVPPGDYTAVVTYTTSQGKVAATAEHTFQIQAYKKLENPEILTPTYPVTTYTNTPFAPQVSCQWGYVANQTGQAQLRWYILNEADDILCESPQDSLELPPETYSCSYSFQDGTTAIFPSGGLYRLVAEISMEDQVIQDTLVVQVMSAPTLTLTNYVTPENIDENPTTANTLIQLSASKLDSTGIPVSFVAANGPYFIANDPENSITIRLEQIKDVNSLLIYDAPLVIAARYGKLSGESPLSPQREEGDATLVQVTNGVTQFQYSPGNGKLDADESATITLNVHQCTQNGTPVTPPIGQIEIHINGVDTQ